MREISFDRLDPDQRSILDSAGHALHFAFTNSHSLWGAAVQTTTGEVFLGANMLISATGMVVCAEVAALCAANVSGHRNVKRMAVIGRRTDSDIAEPATSCGRCRQVLFEFSQMSGVDIELIYSNTDKTKILVTSIGELLPTPYDSRILGSVEDLADEN